MRHNRTQSFDHALAVQNVPSQHWKDVCADPNDPRVLVQRSRVLHDAWKPDVADRVGFIERRCAGRSVLDIGCVAHDIARFESRNWLHGRVAAAADRCVGVDVDVAGVQAMIERGYEAIAHDLAEGIGPLAAHAPFDVIVAGELIEHLTDLGILFRTASEALADDGQLIITTPNPYNPDRVWAGQRGVIWENADHVLYAFPAGVAELASRHGLVLSEVRCTERPRPVWISQPIRALKRAIRGSGWRSVGYTSADEVRPTSIRPLRALLDVLPRWNRRFVGPTSIYVVRRR